MGANLTFEIAGKKVNNPVNWKDIQIEATFINTTEEGGLVISPQANVDVERFDFVTDGSNKPNKAARIIRQYIEDGKNNNGPGIFEGLPYRITASDLLNSSVVFDGILDLTDQFVELNPVRVQAKSREVGSLNTFGERAQGVTFGFLLEKEVILPSDFVDVEYVVEKKLDPLGLIISGVVIFMMIKELQEALRQLSADLADFLAHLTGGAGGPIAAPIFALAKVLIQFAYTALILIAILKLIQDLINQLISPVRKHKAMRLRTLLDRATNYLGFKLESPLTELDDIVYLPSDPDAEKPLTEGIPKPQDFGYKLDEIFDLVKRMANAKLQLIDGVLQLRSLNDPFWVKTSTYKLPGDPNGKGLLYETITYNTNEFRANRLIQFLTDVSDEWTVNNFKGTNFEVITTPIQSDEDKNILMKGLDNVQIPCALGNRKDKLNLVEVAVKAVAAAADTVINAFGGNSKLADKVKNRVGMLKVGTNSHSVAKLLFLDSNQKLPVNHRDVFSAKVLYNKYHNEKSFVANSFGGQYQLFRDVRVPFGFTQFLQLINNSHFTNFDGRLGKVDSIKWKIGADSAIMDYRIQEPYSRNMQETFIEPE